MRIAALLVACLCGDALHRNAPTSFIAQPATSGAIALYKRLLPLCA